MTAERPSSAESDQPQAAGNAPQPERNPDLDRDVVAEAAIPKPVESEGGQGRRVLAAVFWLLASLAVLFGGVSVWAHQTLLTSDGWGGIVGDVVADKEVTDAVSAVLVERLAEATGIRDTVANAIPGPSIIAGAVTGIVQDRIVKAVEGFASSAAFDDAFVKVNERAHDAAMKAIRGGDTAALTSDQGILSINIFPLIEGVLKSLQDSGIISGSRDIPDLSEYQLPSEAVTVLEKVLGRDIPDDVGTIVLIDSERFDTVQTVVRWFDGITGALLLLWVVFTALALWLSRPRIRMVLWLSVGAIAALMAGRFLTRIILNTVMRNQQEPDARVVIDAIIDASVDSLMYFTFILIVVALLVAVFALVWERRGEFSRPAMETPPRTLGHWVREHAPVILGVGVAIIAVVTLWAIGGPEIAMLVAAALLLLAIAVKVLSDTGKGDDGSRTVTEG